MASIVLHELTRRAWALPVLALVNRGTVARVHPLANELGASRAAVKASLEHLVALRLLRRNPGHGHPLRPEFTITAAGHEVAAVADRLWQAADAAGLGGLVRRRWALPVLVALQQAPALFSQIRRSLAPVSDRALSLTLKELQAANWVTRKVVSDTHPPGSRYALTPRSEPLVALAARL